MPTRPITETTKRYVWHSEESSRLTHAPKVHHRDDPDEDDRDRDPIRVDLTRRGVHRRDLGTEQKVRLAVRAADYRSRRGIPEPVDWEAATPGVLQPAQRVAVSLRWLG